MGGCLFQGTVRCGVWIVNDLCLLTLGTYAKGVITVLGVCVCVCVLRVYTPLKAFIKLVNWLYAKIRRFSKYRYH